MKLRHAFLYIAVVSIPVLFSNIAWAQTPITGCTIITQSGSYVLKNNIAAAAAELKPTWIPGYDGCIVIAANFVTINLAGCLITGPGGFSVAIAQDTTHPHRRRCAIRIDYWFLRRRWFRRNGSHHQGRKCEQ